MRIYLNESGIVTTVIPHGQPMRQGNRLDVYVARPEGVPDRSPVLSFRRKNGREHLSSAGSPVLCDSGDSVKFTRLTTTELTYDLRDGQRYSVRHVRVPYDENSPMNRYGDVVMSVCVIEGEECVRQAPVEFSIEKSYGDFPERMTASEYQKAMAAIEEIRSTYIKVFSGSVTLYNGKTIKGLTAAAEQSGTEQIGAIATPVSRSGAAYDGTTHAHIELTDADGRRYHFTCACYQLTDGSAIRQNEFLCMAFGSLRPVALLMELYYDGTGTITAKAI